MTRHPLVQLPRWLDAAAFLALAAVVLRAASYLFEKGRAEQWDIPPDFIKVEAAAMITQGVLFVGLMLYVLSLLSVYSMAVSSRSHALLVRYAPAAIPFLMALYVLLYARPIDSLAWAPLGFLLVFCSWEFIGGIYRRIPPAPLPSLAVVALSSIALMPLVKTLGEESARSQNRYPVCIVDSKPHVILAVYEDKAILGQFDRDKKILSPARHRAPVDSLGNITMENVGPLTRVTTTPTRPGPQTTPVP